MVTGGGNGPYYMIRPRDGATLTNHYLLAVLNHPMSKAFVRTNTSSLRGCYYSHGKQFIANFPIPPAAEPERTAATELPNRKLPKIFGFLRSRSILSISHFDLNNDSMTA